MPKPPKKTDHLKALAANVNSTEARQRAKHNSALQPGDIRTATGRPEADRLTRAIKKAQAADLKQREQEKEGRPQPGEIFEAESGISDEQARKERTERFLRLARERFKLVAEAESQPRHESLDDLEFRVGMQWPKDIEMARTLDNRPALTLNRFPATIRQVTNEQRQQRPTVQINPVGDGADTDTAEVLQGVIRHVEVQSDAEIAYDTAFDSMVTIGFGYWRILPEYSDEELNTQELKIKRIKNAFSVYFDPAAIEPDYSDARYAFIIEDVPRSEYQERYSDSEVATLNDFSSVGDNAADWATKDTVRVAEYFYVKDEPDPISGRNRRTVYWAKINAVEVIDGSEDKTEGRPLPGKKGYIPIVPVLGDDLDINGKRHLAGLVRHAKDPQRMVNYWYSAATETIALAPRAPFIAAEGQIEGHEAEWRDSNIRSLPVLQYKPVSAGMNLAPPPQRNSVEVPIQAFNEMMGISSNEFKATTGLYDPSLGQTKADQSGRAIQSLQKQGSIATLNFSDNLSRSIRHTGRILIDLIPFYYDAAHIQRIIKPDGSVDHVIMHNGQPDEAQALMTEKIKKVYDVGVGQYDVTVSVGPSYQTKRQESVAAELALLQSVPEIAPSILDLVVGNMDWPQAKEMAKRLKKQLPPNLLDDANDDPEQQVMVLQAKLQALSQQHDLLTQVVQKQNDIINNKQVEQQGKADIERMKIEAQLTIAEITAKTQEATTRLKMENDMWRDLHGSAHELALQKDQQGHEAEQAESQQGHELKVSKQAAKARPKTNGKTQ